ncbi:hypothetical protein [Halotia branconii]|uniref:Uncharacterized protein n=1 Tax=Halotia branconii CENA392 TaxID=1539056 RepID=A0AAJ6NN09_9CYAN|nr:hypothetical protein [Halotia branconii]WGV23238.1 hypothetical protein QI031_15505 [Halotia branconii CENA392]
MKNEEFLIEQSSQLLSQGKDTENILAFLRKNGCSKSQSIVILKKLQKIPLDEAQKLVHLSQTWQDTRDYDEELNRLFYEILMRDYL